MNKRKKAIIYNSCHICGSETTQIEDPQLKVTYSLCEACDFIYKNKEHHISMVEELDVYSKHNNSFESEGYVKMFEDLIEDFIKPLNISGKGLEFGSGPGPVLLELLKQNGLQMYQYDPFYYKSEDYKNYKYNLITTTEVAEHFSEPLKEFKHLASLLNDGGYLVIMTLFRKMDIVDFYKWWYRRDETHISFYNIKTLEYLAKTLKLDIINNNDKNVIVMKKQRTSE